VYYILQKVPPTGGGGRRRGKNIADVIWREKFESGKRKRGNMNEKGSRRKDKEIIEVKWIKRHREVGQKREKGTCR
jgi:hypothetical protein